MEGQLTLHIRIPAILEYGVHILLFCLSLLFRKQKNYILLFIGGNFHITTEPEFQ